MSISTIPFQQLPNDENYERAVVVIGDSETAPNPASTKGPLYGPAIAVYERHAQSGSISTYLYDDLDQVQEDWGHAWLPESVKAGDLS